MRQAHLLGVSGHKRTRYFQKAAAEAGLFFGFSDWKLFLEHPSLPDQDLFVKLDPFPAAGVFFAGSGAERPSVPDSAGTPGGE